MQGMSQGYGSGRPPKPGETQGPGPLTRLERVVLDAALKGDAPDLATLRAQLAKTTAVSRTHSGVGFVTRLGVPEEFATAGDSATKYLRPVLADHPALSEPVEFLLQLKGGRLAVLEAFCYSGGWPGDETPFRVRS